MQICNGIVNKQRRIIVDKKEMWDQCVPVKVVQWDDLKDNDFMSKWAVPKAAAKKEAEVVEDLSIDKLGTTLYIYNLFCRHRLDTVKDILAFTNEEWWHKGGVGQKCWPELERVLNTLREYRNVRFKDLPIDSPFWDVMISFDTPLTHIRLLPLNFSRRLEKAGVITLDDMLHLRSDSWDNMRGIDKWNKRDYLADAKGYDWDLHHSMERRLYLVYEGHLGEPWVQSLISLCDTSHVTYQTLLSVLQKTGYPRDEKIRDIFWSDAEGRKLMAARVLTALEEQEFDGLSEEELLASFPAGLGDAKALAGLLQELVDQNEIFMERNLYFRRYLAISDFIQSRFDGITRQSMECRLQGLTMGETGQKLGITKERVRQLQVKVMPKIPLVEEMRFMAQKVTYEGLTDDDFAYVFQVPEETAHFLSLFTDEETESAQKDLRLEALEQVATDDSLLENIRERAKERMENLPVKLEIKDEKAPKTKAKLFSSLLPQMAADYITYEELIQTYNQYISEKFPGKEKQLSVNEFFITKAAATLPDVLTSADKRLRFYPIEDHDYAPMFYELHLAQYEGLEISSKKIFVDHPDLMEEYDIRNYQELHNFFKKWQIIEKKQEKKYLPADMVMARVPTIRFGKTDRTKQVNRLIEKYHPSTQAELVRLITKEYGINSGSIFAYHWLDGTVFEKK